MLKQENPVLRTKNVRLSLKLKRRNLHPSKARGNLRQSQNLRAKREPQQGTLPDAALNIIPLLISLRVTIARFVMLLKHKELTANKRTTGNRMVFQSRRSLRMPLLLIIKSSMRKINLALWIGLLL